MRSSPSTLTPSERRSHSAFISAVFRIERTLADAPRKKKGKIRDKRSRPIVEAFFSWCDAEADKVLDETPIANGVRYARNQRVGLLQFLEDGSLLIHNNMSERSLRRIAVGVSLCPLSSSAWNLERAIVPRNSRRAAGVLAPAA
jgi:hypothetical protein